jgi:hypothetical protein
MAQSQFRFVTWNLKYTTSEQSYRARWEFLKTSVEWDVIARQEVSAAAWR